MSDETDDVLGICEQLPPAKRAEVADFARFLLARQGDGRWEQIIAEAKPRPKLDAFLQRTKRDSRKLNGRELNGTGEN